MQEDSPEDFKEFSLTARKLETIAKEKPVDTSQLEGQEEIKEGHGASISQEASYAESFAKFLEVLQESKYQKNFTFTMYKILKNALIKKQVNLTFVIRLQKLSLDQIYDRNRGHRHDIREVQIIISLVPLPSMQEGKRLFQGQQILRGGRLGQKDHGFNT